VKLQWLRDQFRGPGEFDRYRGGAVHTWLHHVYVRHPFISRIDHK